MGGPSFTLQHSKSKEIAAEAVFMPLSDVCILWSHWPSTQVHPKGRHEAGPKLMTEGGSLEAQSALRKDILKPCKPALRSDFQRTCLLGLLPVTAAHSGLIRHGSHYVDFLQPNHLHSTDLLSVLNLLPGLVHSL